ncbi:hypothetical protein WMF31_28455 [Sorangium sp. So ce1036]|uniref:hypothetical protein n=1 Tax=Sorangium sp. So ce1036 TaxID=3133328 RepID=UPI003F02ACF5
MLRTVFRVAVVPAAPRARPAARPASDLFLVVDAFLGAAPRCRLVCAAPVFLVAPVFVVRVFFGEAPRVAPDRVPAPVLRGPFLAWVALRAWLAVFLVLPAAALVFFPGAVCPASPRDVAGAG